MSDRWPLLVILLAAAIWFYRSPYQASDLDIVPDSEEYAIGALELLETGNYHLTIEDRWLPPRYPPWFSASVIAPAYVLLGHGVGNAVLPITAIALAGVACAWAIGRHIAGTAGGTLAALALTVLPSFSYYAGEVMTDAPCTALMLLACVIYLRIRTRPSSKQFLLAGVLIALTTLFRNLFAAMLLPFVVAAIRLPKRRLRCLIALGLPMLAAAAATGAYNTVTFGSPFRNGYHFWTASPYDYFWLTFSPSYVTMNLIVLGKTMFPIAFAVALVAWAILRMRYPARLRDARITIRDAITFFALSVTPIIALHLLYFFPTQRFFLPLTSATAVIAGGFVALLLGDRAASVAKLLVVPMLLLTIAARAATPPRIPLRRVAAEHIRDFTPDNATVISSIDPVYLDRLAARGSHRRVVPLSRNVEYASKLLVRKRIAHPDPPVHRWPDVRPAGLIRGGAADAVKFVAAEHVPQLVSEAAAGAPVYVEATGTSAADTSLIAQLEERFRFEPRAPNLYQLMLK